MMHKKPQKGSLEMVGVGQPVSGENFKFATSQKRPSAYLAPVNQRQEVSWLTTSCKS